MRELVRVWQSDSRAVRSTRDESGRQKTADSITQIVDRKQPAGVRTYVSLSITQGTEARRVY